MPSAVVTGARRSADSIQVAVPVFRKETTTSPALRFGALAKAGGAGTLTGVAR